MSKTKRCPKCKQNKPTTDYYRNRSNADGLCTRCKTCFREDQEARRARKPRLRCFYPLRDYPK